LSPSNSPNAPPTPLKYLQGYPAALLDQVRPLIAQGRLGDTLRQRYPVANPFRSDPALYAHVNALKQRHLRNAPPLSKVVYDGRLQRAAQALGTHTAVSRVQGGQLKAKREIRIASLFRDAPEPFLRMIVAHELAHLKERAHDKAFYALCSHIEPDYHHLEFDTRLWLTALETEGGTAG
jgi:hypothetical protein